MITFNNIVNRFDWFVKQNVFVNSFSYGSPEGVDLDKFENYPLMHLVYSGANYDVQQKTYNLEVYILDLGANKDKTNNNPKIEREIITECEQVAEDILADMRNGGNVFTFDYEYQLSGGSITPLIEERSNTLTGVLLDIQITVGFTAQACNLPQYK